MFFKYMIAYILIFFMFFILSSLVLSAIALVTVGIFNPLALTAAFFVGVIKLSVLVSTLCLVWFSFTEDGINAIEDFVKGK